MLATGVLLTGMGATASTLGGLRIIALEGIGICVDDDYMATSTGTGGGLLIRGVTADGEHTLHAVKGRGTVLHSEFTAETNATTTTTIDIR